MSSGTDDERPLTRLNGAEQQIRLARLEEKLTALRETFDRYEEAAEEKLKLQAAEYERRLEDLNHEKDQLKQMQGTYVPRETFDRYREMAEKTLAGLERFNANLQGKMWIGGAATLIMAAAIAAAMKRL